MKFLSQTQLKVDEQPQSLEFLVSEKIGWSVILLEAGLLLVFLWIAFDSWIGFWNDLLMVAFGIGLLMTAGSLLRGRNAQLMVTSESLTANERSSVNTLAQLQKSIAELQSFGYETGGGRHGTPGLYADGQLVLPALSRAEVRSILETVRRKFPEFEYISEPVTQGIFAGVNEIVPLKLDRSTLSPKTADRDVDEADGRTTEA